MPGLSPYRGCDSLSEAEVYSVREKEHGTGGCRGFSLECFLPAQTREIPGARDAEQ